jgi:hypothetical protein
VERGFKPDDIMLAHVIVYDCNPNMIKYLIGEGCTQQYVAIVMNAKKDDKTNLTRALCTNLTLIPEFIYYMMRMCKYNTLKVFHELGCPYDDEVLERLLKLNSNRLIDTYVRARMLS